MSLCAFASFNGVSSSNVTTALLDRTEYLKRPRVKYHLYDPQLFTMYTECLPKLDRPCYANQGYNTFVHSLDILFLESIIALNESVDPSEADLFIVPVFYNQATVTDYPCYRNWKDRELTNQMYEVLRSLGHYKSGVRNHFLMADHWASGFPGSWDKFVFEAELIVGRFENPSIQNPSGNTVLRDDNQIFGVGYATRAGLYRQCAKEHTIHRTKDPVPMLERKYLASFTGGNHKYFYHRNLLYNWIRDHPEVPEDIFVSVYSKDEAFSDKNPLMNGHDVCRNSLICLSIMGDTPTTDRIWVAFEFPSLIGVLSVEKDKLLPLLPYPLRVPWEEIIVWIDTDTFVKNPYEAMRGVALALSDDEKERRFNLMRKHQRDVLWAFGESVAALNVLEDANLRVEVLS